MFNGTFHVIDGITQTVPRVSFKMLSEKKKNCLLHPSKSRVLLGSCQIKY